MQMSEFDGPSHVSAYESAPVFTVIGQEIDGLNLNTIVIVDHEWRVFSVPYVIYKANLAALRGRQDHE